jgi:hypothetical protein
VMGSTAAKKRTESTTLWQMEFIDVCVCVCVCVCARVCAATVASASTRHTQPAYLHTHKFYPLNKSELKRETNRQ